MPIEPIRLIGAGGHAAVVLDALLAGTPDVAVVVRDGRTGLELLGYPVATPEIDEAELSDAPFHVAIGSAPIRARLHGLALRAGGQPRSVIHPAAHVSKYAIIGEGAFIAAGAIVAARARVGDGAIVNHGAVVDHDAYVGAFAHVAPNAALGGGASVGEQVLVGSGAIVLPGVSIARGSVIGAGAVVLVAIGQAGIWVGNPARRMGSA